MQTITLQPGQSVTIVAASTTGTGSGLPDLPGGGGTGSGGDSGGTGGGSTGGGPLADGGQRFDVYMPWDNPPARIEQPMGVKDVVACHFRTGSVLSPSPKMLSAIEVANYGSAQSERYCVLSKAAGDFDNPVGPGAISRGTCTFGIGVAPAGMLVLEPNTDYWFNIRNDDPCSCAATGICDVFLHLRKVGGV